MEFDELIQYENENTALDFKAIQYRKDIFEAFLKDVNAMANAMIEGKRYIVIGVKLHPDGSRTLYPILKDEFIDEAVFQQLVRENIEPEIPLSYSPYVYKGDLLGVFEIGPCDDPPYMMRRDNGRLHKGDAWIRRGSQQDRLTRPDLDRILANKARSVGFSGKVKVGFGDNFEPTLTLAAVMAYDPPSKRAQKEIEEELVKREKSRKERDKRKREASEYPGLASLIEGADTLRSLAGLFGRGYEHMTEEELRKGLATVSTTYKEDDEVRVQGSGVKAEGRVRGQAGPLGRRRP